MWFGDSFKETYKDKKGVLKKRALTVFDLIWDLHNFKNSLKIKVINKSLKDIIKNERYIKTAREELKSIYGNSDEDLEQKITIYQAVDGDKLYVVDILNNIIFLNTNKPKDLGYTRYTAELRQGMPEAPGRGMFEKIMNIIIQNKKAREWIYDIQEITSKLTYAKVKDGKNDKVVNKQIQKLKTGLVIPVTSPDNIPVPIESGGHNQLVELNNKVAEGIDLYNKVLVAPDVLSGDAKTIGSNSSGVAIQSLAEYASSVHKDMKKRFNRVVEEEYRKYDLPYLLQTFKSSDNIKEFLTPVEWGTVKRNIVDYETAVKQAELVAEGKAPEEVQKQLVAYKEKLTRDFEKKNIISDEILKKLRADVKGIQIVASGEKLHPTVERQFVDKMLADFDANPENFVNPSRIALLKQQAKKYGYDELEISEIINSITQQ